MTTTPEVKKSNHQANIVRVAEVLAHPDPETTDLELIVIGGYQVVVRKGQFAIGDLAVYIQPDSVVPQTIPFKFIWEGHVGIDGTVPAKRRRITVRKFRGQYSEGLLLPVSDFISSNAFGFMSDGVTFQYIPGGYMHECGVTLYTKEVNEGDDVSDLLGITHYDPDADKPEDPSASAPARKARRPKTLKGWVRFAWHGIMRKLFPQTHLGPIDTPIAIPTYDIEAFKNYKGTFAGDDEIVVTEKVHGSNARYMYLDGIQYAGSRTQWKHADSKDEFRKALVQNPWIGAWCAENPGLVLWGELVPTQGDKWAYGTKKGEVKFLAFDIFNPETHTFYDYDTFLAAVPDESVRVPELYRGTFGAYSQALLLYVDGLSAVPCAKNIREGNVLKTVKEERVRGLGRKQLKVVSNVFLDKDSK
jgi:hypothetical protein